MRNTSVVAVVLLLEAVAGAHPPAGVPAPTQWVAPPPKTVGGGAARLDEIQALLKQQRVDGWLLTDDGGRDLHALELVRPKSHVARRWFYFIPASGDPVAMAARDDAAAFEGLGARTLTYLTWRELDGHLRTVLKGRRKVAMTRGDVAAVETVRAAAVTTVSSGDLVTHLRARWTDAQRKGQLHTAMRLVALKDEAFRFIAARLAAGGHVNEFEVQQQLMRSIGGHGMETQFPPVVASGANSADPKYQPTGRRSAEIKAGDVVRLELAARAGGQSDAVYASLAFSGYVGSALPDKVKAAWEAVRKARDQALALLKQRSATRSVAGWEVDAQATAALASFADKRRHPTGHSLGTHLRGEGPNLDDFERRDERQLVTRTGMTVAPGVYLPGEFGIRSGVVVYLADEGPVVTPDPAPATMELIQTAPPATAAPATPAPATAAPTTPAPGPATAPATATPSPLLTP